MARGAAARGLAWLDEIEGHKPLSDIKDRYPFKLVLPAHQGGYVRWEARCPPTGSQVTPDQRGGDVRLATGTPGGADCPSEDGFPATRSVARAGPGRGRGGGNRSPRTGGPFVRRPGSLTLVAGGEEINVPAQAPRQTQPSTAELLLLLKFGHVT